MGRRLWATREDFVAGVTHHAYRQLREEMGLPHTHVHTTYNAWRAEIDRGSQVALHQTLREVVDAVCWSWDYADLCLIGIGRKKYAYTVQESLRMWRAQGGAGA
jgi:hypothetical protein